MQMRLKVSWVAIILTLLCENLLFWGGKKGILQGSQLDFDQVVKDIQGS